MGSEMCIRDSFYAAFGSKDALFELAMSRYAKDSLERLKHLAEQYGPIQALQRLPLMVIDNEKAPAKACMLSKTLLELSAHNHPLASTANQHLLTMETQFEAMFQRARDTGAIAQAQNPKALARRYQSDLLGLRISAEREGIDAALIAQEIAESLERL